MGTEEDALAGPFGDWLAARWPDVQDLEVGEIELPKSGFSARTVFVPLRFRRGAETIDEKVVLRLENPEPAIYVQQAPGLDVEIEIQYRAMESLHATGRVPLAPLIGYESDAGVLGAPFFAMNFIEGRVMVEAPPYASEGFFVDASPDSRRRMISEGLRVMAEVHAIDWRAAGFEWLVPASEQPSLLRQVELWEDSAIRELRDRKHPDLEQAFAWLHTNAPEGLEPGLSWGDSRPGNIIYGADDQILCLTDFEAIAVAPTEIDLGWWLMFDRTQHEAVSVDRLPGEPTRDEQLAIYAEYARRPVPDTRYFEVFAAARYAAIVVRVMNRLVDRGGLDPDHRVWLRNPAADALAAMLEEYA